jgi:hypothetical protein
LMLIQMSSDPQPDLDFLGWAQLGSNQRPLACKASALPLSYAPFAARRGNLRLTGPAYLPFVWLALFGRPAAGPPPDGARPG